MADVGIHMRTAPGFELIYFCFYFLYTLSIQGFRWIHYLAGTLFCVEMPYACIEKEKICVVLSHC